MKKHFLATYLADTVPRKDTPINVPFQKIQETFDLENKDRFKPDDNYTDLLTTAFGLGELSALKKQTQVFLNEPNYQCPGASDQDKTSYSAGILTMKYFSITGQQKFCLAIKPKLTVMPDIRNNLLTFGLHGFFKEKNFLVDTLLMPAFDKYRCHQGTRSVPISSDTIGYAETYAQKCMEQLTSGRPIIMLQNLIDSAPESLVKTLTGNNIGPIPNDFAKQNMMF